MKTFVSHINILAITIGLLFSNYTNSKTVINSEKFDTSLSIWNDDRENAILNTLTTSRSSQFTNIKNDYLSIESNNFYDSFYGFISIGLDFKLSPTPEITVSSNASEILDGDTTPSIIDNTNYGSADFGTTISRTFTIENTGTSALNISNISLSNNTDFSIVGAPYSSPIAISSKTTFTVQFNSLNIGSATTTVIINNDDSDESTYNFTIEANALISFFDSDGDGILDNIDIDDDNDGIEDSIEEAACKNSSIASSTNYKFLNETFGTGDRTQINTTYDAVTTYCYEDGTFGTATTACPSLGDNNLSDGEYTVYYKAGNGDGMNNTPTGEVASWADTYWYTGEDHTSGDSNGRFALFNAAKEPGVFYTANIIGALPNIPVTYSFWVLNLDTTTAPGIETRLRPNILVEFRDLNDNVLASITTGDIPPSINGDPTSSWHQFTANLTFNVSAFNIYFYNNQPGGLGNDLAIDDIVISQTLCDADSDGVANVFDLDSDNDGIPDAVENGLGNITNGKGKIDTWVDTNSNGMHDATEGITALDSDLDGTPNFLDLDSDNDTIFDVDESGAGNTANLNYQNGDGDITGDGVGDGPDTDAVRETDIDSDGTIEYYTDGILDIYDYSNGTTISTAYGNSNQGLTGSGWEYYVIDTDNDGTPDYLDTTSNGSTYDISHTLYANLDANNDGTIDDTNDTDEDGILDLFDTNNALFGSPRNLDSSYSLYFDGRNDYIEDTNIIPSGSATLMAFIKTDGTNITGDNRIIAGQNNFYIQINNSENTITAVSEGVSLTSTSTITDNIWMHIAMTTESEGDVVLYINGEEEARDTSNSGGITSHSNFMIGRATTNSNYFKGEIDEVRVFNVALTTNELKRMVYQELDDTNNFNSGKIIPINICATLGSSLVKYYKMDAFYNDILDDKKTATKDITGAKMYNFKDIYIQTAPLPYETTEDGNWTNPTSWLHGNVWDITSKQNNTNGASIIHIKNNINLNGSYNTLGTAGLIIDSEKEFTIEADKGLYNSWYLELNGLIDLEGESQLIQTEGSILNPTSSGSIERDQQGTSNTYTYNYWSSPVGITNDPANNSSYTLPDVISNVGFLTSGYNGTSNPVKNADYWIWKYANNLSNTYSQWQHVRSTGTMLAGQGFTMKGPGASTPNQNYVFLGKPYNGNITLPITAGNDYLIGNPYASALDANEFIKDNISTTEAQGRNPNGNIINGALYFWDHFSNNTHSLAQYDGGYAIYTLAGSVAAISNDTRINATGTIGSKIPERYIPIGQGFFVSALLDTNLTGTNDGGITSTTLDNGLSLTINGGDIIFKNSQRAFKTETADPSLFLKSSNKNFKSSTTNTNIDTRSKIRLMFDSPGGYHRQLLLTADENTTNDFDLGYEAILIESNNEDIYWLLNNTKLIIQSIKSLNKETSLPIGIKIKKNGLASIKIDGLDNINNEQEIYLHDKELNLYYNLREKNYESYLDVGEYANRFEITFKNAAPSKLLKNNEFNDKNMEVFFSNEKGSVIINNPELRNIESVEVYNILGQSLFKFCKQTTKNYNEYKIKQINPGAYIIKIETEYGKLSKKVLIKQ